MKSRDLKCSVKSRNLSVTAGHFFPQKLPVLFGKVVEKIYIGCLENFIVGGGVLYIPARVNVVFL